MNSKIITALLLVMLFSACAPKYNYINTNALVSKFDRIVVVIDYVHFVDGVSELMNYDLIKNQRQIAKLQIILSNLLSKNTENHPVDFAVISSGVGFNPDRPFAYYRDGELQTDLIYPPFFIDSPYPLIIQDQLLSSLMEAQRIALTPTSKDNQKYLQRVRITPVDLNEPTMYSQIDRSTTEPSAILHIRVVAPRVSFLKTLGSSVVSVGVSSGNVHGNHVGIGLPLTSGAKSLTTALLYDNENGQVLWKNQRSGDLSRLSHEAISHFFKDFPVKP